MKELMNLAMKELKDLDVVEVGVLKICLVSFGVLIGMFAARRRHCRVFLPLTVMVFLGTYIFVIMRFISTLEEEIEE